MTERELAYLEELELGCERGEIHKMVEWASFYDAEHPELITEEIAARMKRYYELGVERGIPMAFLNLGAMYYKGVFVERDFAKAIELYKRAAKSGDEEAACKALGNLGYCYYYGRSVPVDLSRAFSYYLKGALYYEDPVCLYKLGDMYRYGDFVERDEAFAVGLYWKASYNCEEEGTRGDLCRKLGECYLEGIGVERDVTRAIKLLSEASGCTYQKLARKDPFAGELIRKIDQLLERAKAELRQML